ncbi:MAG TPA: ribonuclease HII [Bacteroidia bacterium]|nr:ribonuclease HII [Bacteroidia bacterium]
MLKSFFNKDYLEAGCDEAGRGCLAGPVFAAAVILPKKATRQIKELSKVNDSKKLSASLRHELKPIIEKTALSFAVEMVQVKEIDEINILNASFLAMHKAISKLNTEPELLLIDGNRFNPYLNSSGRKIPHQCIIEGDGKYLSIACASILAKTYRDEYMHKLHEKFPAYNWNKNKGYGTSQHRLAIKQHGANEHHRTSFTLLPSQLELDIFKQ